MNEKVSVIVPIYRVEQYLDACIVSIQNQTHRNLEIILVDDGSPDASGEICERYAKEDSRIIVLHKENGGLSDARNAGLRIATGDYLYFVDSDDRLTETSVEEMLKFAEDHQAQMVIGGFERFDDDTGDVFFSTEAEGLYVRVMDQAGVVKDFYRDGCQAWAVLYRREIHDGIFFPVGEINEDEAIVFHIMERVTTAVVTNRVVYSYRHRRESITTSHFSPKKLVWCKHCKQNLDWVREHHPELEVDALVRYRGSLMWALTEIALSDQRYPEEEKRLLAALRDNCAAMRQVPFAGIKERIRFFMMVYLPNGLYKCMMRMKRGST